MTKNFYKRFGLQLPLEEARNKFMTRVSMVIFIPLQKFRWFWEPSFLRWISVELGQDFSPYIISSQGRYEMTEHINSRFSLNDIVSGDFRRCLLVIELVYRYLKSHDVKSYRQEELKRVFSSFDSLVKICFEKSEIDLGISWRKGRFYPSGARLLDEKLIEDVFDWLSEYEEEKTDFEKALSASLEKRYDDAVGDCFNCIESMAKKITGRKRNLDNNKADLLAKLKFSREWASILNSFIEYAHEHGRHGSEGRHSVDPQEAEAYIYLTGLLARAIIQKISTTSSTS